MARRTSAVLTFSGTEALYTNIADFARDRRLNSSELIRKVMQWAISHPAEIDEKVLKVEEEEIKI